ncbi:Maf family protein [Angustibacter peucedani]
MSTPPAPGPLLVLASASPARLRTLRSAGVEPDVQVSDVDEDAAVLAATGVYGPLEADQVALVLARAKAEAVAATRDDGLVLGCDSVLELDGETHGKPADAAEALARWRRMRGRSGVLHTGHWVVDLRDGEDGGSGATLGAVSSTTVHFADVPDDELEAYVATGEPLAVAGAFTTDGLGGAFVRGIEGDHHTVVGVSLPVLRELLGECGVRWTDLWSPAAAI